MGTTIIRYHRPQLSNIPSVKYNPRFHFMLDITGEETNGNKTEKQIIYKKPIRLRYKRSKGATTIKIPFVTVLNKDSFKQLSFYPVNKCFTGL